MRNEPLPQKMSRDMAQRSATRYLDPELGAGLQHEERRDC
jgi:hypothetical protein